MKTNNHNWFDWFAAIVLVAAFVTVGVRLRITEWTTNLEVIEVLGLIGCVLGLLLGASRFDPLACQIFGLNYTIFFIPWQLGLIIGKNIEWEERILSVVGRLSFSINEVFNNRPIQDPILFLTIVSIFIWLLAIVAGYQLARTGKPWGQVFLLGLVMAIVDFYTPYQAQRDNYSGFFVFLILVLVARMYLLHSRQDWSNQGIAVDPEIGYDLGRTVAVSGLVLVLLAWNVPTLVDALTPGTEIQKELAKQWESVRNRFQNAVAGLQNPVSIVSDYYGTELALGTGGSQGDDTVFNVQVANFRPTGVRFYWRARSFDFYDGTQWKTSQERTRAVPANEWPFQYPQFEGRMEVLLSFIPNVNSLRNIYTAGIPLQVTRNSEVLADVYADGTADVVAMTATPALRGGDVIKERAWVSAPTVLQLKGSTSNYPEEIKRLYLQLPPNLPARIPELAKQITAEAATPYEKVIDLTFWLRNNIEYQLTIPPVPQDRDILDWFLFDLRKGYCNYYATAEVIMLRSLGIPARMAVGYAEGTTDQQYNTLFTVRRRDSHAWPEVYFEKYGWIEFEPTSAQPSTILLSGETVDTRSLPGRGNNPGLTDGEPTPGPDTGPAPAAPAPTTDPVMVVLVIAIPLSVGLLIALGFWMQRTGRLNFLRTPLPVLVAGTLEKRGVNPPNWLKNWAEFARLSPMERMFSRFTWMLFLLGRKPEAGQTPAERVSVLISAAPTAREPAQIFLEEYHREEYSLTRGNFEIAEKANRRLWREVAVSALRRLVNG